MRGKNNFDEKMQKFCECVQKH